MTQLNYPRPGESLPSFSERAHERVTPHTMQWRGGQGAVAVTVLAYSLGATMAYCIIGLGDKLEPGNFSATWLPVTQLDCIDTQAP